MPETTTDNGCDHAGLRLDSPHRHAEMFPDSRNCDIVRSGYLLDGIRDIGDQALLDLEPMGVLMGDPGEFGQS